MQQLYDWLLSQDWYMRTLMWEHVFRLTWCFVLMCAYALVEFNILPGQSYKIRKDHVTSRRQVLGFLASNLQVFLFAHLIPLAIFDHFFYTPRSWPTEAPSLFTMLWKAIMYMLVFDACTHLVHEVSHMFASSTRLPTWLTLYFSDEHAVHHHVCGRYVYAWTGFIGSKTESVAGLFFFLIAMIPLRMDPLTRLLAILIFHICATNAHSGYDFPWMFQNWIPYGPYLWHGSRGHYIHHRLGKYNLSTFFALFDLLFNSLYVDEPQLKG
eukprot:GDKH01011632.1.p1 GENE.GDKH01011632.1~~GDKH01011632.1.p1  ORF type:complete len:268 (+),score=-7.63 GDKH01011632.1:127-930(+)